MPMFMEDDIMVEINLKFNIIEINLKFNIIEIFVGLVSYLSGVEYG